MGLDDRDDDDDGTFSKVPSVALPRLTSGELLLAGEATSVFKDSADVGEAAFEWTGVGAREDDSVVDSAAAAGAVAAALDKSLPLLFVLALGERDSPAKRLPAVAPSSSVTVATAVSAAAAAGFI